MEFRISQSGCYNSLIAERKTAHTRLDTKDVVVHREHLLQGRRQRLQVQGHLGIVNTREVARARRLVLLRLQSEGVHVDARVGRARVVHIRLVLVEVLAELLLEAVLAVQHQLEVLQRADLESRCTRDCRRLLDPHHISRAGGVREQTRAAHLVRQVRRCGGQSEDGGSVGREN